MLKAILKKKTPLQKENLQFEKQFSDLPLLKKIKKLTKDERKRFAINSLKNSLEVRYSNDEVCWKLMQVYDTLLRDKELNQKKKYKWITPKLIEKEDVKWYEKEANSLSLSRNDLNQFSQFFFMLPIDMVKLFELIETIMLTLVQEEEFNALYKLLHYMQEEAVSYPSIPIDIN